MEVKILEIRDKGTFFPILAISMLSQHPKEVYLLGRVGYRANRLILIIMLTINRCEYSPLEWNDRTMTTAHKFITKHWDAIKSADVIDVEYILGESDQPKISERLIHSEV